ncbi:MAG: hypothetical protein NHB32_02240 [Fischerella sp. CENA71]|nr:hypothetical protein [Fischerella sp. CENA71]
MAYHILKQEFCIPLYSLAIYPAEHDINDVFAYLRQQKTAIAYALQIANYIQINCCNFCGAVATTIKERQ